jgi:hypothetical protein
MARHTHRGGKEQRFQGIHRGSTCRAANRERLTPEMVSFAEENGGFTRQNGALTEKNGA